jgi:hypothetical protein
MQCHFPHQLEAGCARRIQLSHYERKIVSTEIKVKLLRKKACPGVRASLTRRQRLGEQSNKTSVNPLSLS